MEIILRSTVIFAFLIVILRIAGRRTLGQMNAFDFVLLLIIGEATQQALLGEDFSVTNALLVISTLIFLDVVLSLVKRRSKTVEKWLEGLPTVLVKDGRVLKEKLAQARVDESDILEAAREHHGLSSMKQVRHAVLEKTGSISVIPESGAST